MAKVALLVGVGNYEHPDDVKPLVSPPKDVAAMQRILLNPQMGEFSEVIPLIDPDPMQMQEAIETLYRARAKDDTVLLFFSGHGIKDDSGKLHFATRLTRKTNGELVKSTAVSARFVQEIMGNSRSRRQVMILDCCFSGAFDPALNAKDDGSLDVQGQLGAEGRVVLTSSSSTQYSFEQQGSELSIYTRFLVEGIETGAADRDSDGKVSVRELHEYATQKVHEAAPKMNPKIIVLKDEGFDVVFAKAQITDPKLKYRKEAERYSMRGEISPAGRTLLNTLRGRLALTLEETQEIEDQVLQPFRERLKHLETYRSTFVAERDREYPFNRETRAALKDLQAILGLREENVLPIEQELLAQSASENVGVDEIQTDSKTPPPVQLQYRIEEPAQLPDPRQEVPQTKANNLFYARRTLAIILLIGGVLSLLISSPWLFPSPELLSSTEPKTSRGEAIGIFFTWIDIGVALTLLGIFLWKGEALSTDIPSPSKQQIKYAGFWRRAIAASIDILISISVSAIISDFLLRLNSLEQIYTFSDRETNASFTIGSLIYTAVDWLYFAAIESSPLQATVGKMIVKSYVTDLNVERVSFGKATKRYFGKYISLLSLGYGFLMAKFTPKKQALHDRMAGCLVLKKP